MKHVLVMCVLVLSFVSTQAPAQEAGEGGAELFGQVFAGHNTIVNDAQSINAFTLQRAELGLRLPYKERNGILINIEGIRSAGPNSFDGVDINSIVMRIKHGFLYLNTGRYLGEVNIQLGMIPDIWIASVEPSYDLRGLAPLGSEEGGFLGTSDLGISFDRHFIDDRIKVRASLTNGEGRNEQERNAGKNLTAVVSGDVLRTSLWKKQLTVSLHAMYRDGSLGETSTRNHRWGGALTVSHRWGFVGAEYMHALGFRARGDKQAHIISAWLNGNLGTRYLGAFGRVSRAQEALDDPDTDILRIQTGLYLDLGLEEGAERTVFGFPRLRLYAGYANQTFGPNASPVKGAPRAANTHAITVTLSARHSARTSHIIAPSE